MAEGFSRKVDDILKKKLNAIDNADNRFIDGFSNIEKTIYYAVRKKVLQMNVDSGKAIFDDTNVQIINELDDIISDAIQSSNYPAKVKEYLRSFDTIKQFNFDAHQDVNDLSQKELEKLINPMQKQVVDQTIEGLTGSGISTQFIQPMKEGIFKNLVGGATITDLEAYLKQFILSDELRLGQFKKYTTQIARDTLNQFDGQVNSRIAGEFGLNAYKYVGSLIDDSRAQCVRWVNKGTLLLDELPNEISWAYSNGTGMIPGTTAENFAVFRGGYNCRHSAIPFKMTKSQMEKYNRDQEQKDENEIDAVDQQINEIDNDIQKNEKQKNADSKKEKLKQFDKNQFITNQDDAIKTTTLQLLNDQDDAIEILVENNTCFALMTPQENKYCNVIGSNLNKLDFKGKTTTNVLQCETGANGSCSIFNDTMSVIIDDKNQKIIAKGYDKELKIIETDIEIQSELKKLQSPFFEGQILKFKPNNKLNLDQWGIAFEYDTNTEKFKIWSMSDISRAIDSNIAPTLTHETAHLIHNTLDKKYDPKNTTSIFPKGSPKQNREKIIIHAMKKNITLNDSPTRYGQSNWSEFYAECMTAYVHAPEWFEKNHKKAFDFFVELNTDVYKFDLNTIKQYK